MTPFPGIAPLGPALATLGRSAGGGVLEVVAADGVDALSLRQGRVVHCHVRGSVWRPVSRVGRDRLVQRLAERMRGRPVELRFVAEQSPGIGPDDGPTAIELSLRALRLLARDVTVPEACRLLRRDCLVVRTPGRFLLAGAMLFPHEHALLRTLQAGGDGSPERCLSAAGGSARALRSLLALRWLGAVGPASSGPYGLLLKKHRQVREGCSAAALLGVSEQANARDARRAFRHLASRVHPDRLGPSAPGAAYDVSQQVITALSRARSAFQPVKG